MPSPLFRKDPFRGTKASIALRLRSAYSLTRDQIAEPLSQESPDKGRLFAQHGGRSSYVGSTFWANAIPTEYNRTDQYVGDPSAPGPSPFPKWYAPYNNTVDWENQRVRAPSSAETRWSRTNLSQCKFCGHWYTVTCILVLLPTKEMCERLCNLFFATVFPLTPILHLPSFADDFRTFWEERSSKLGHDSEIGPLLRRKPSFVCLLSSILFAALKSASTSRLRSILGDDAGLSAGDMYFVAVVSASLTGFPRRPSLYSLAAYIFTQSQFFMEEDFSDSPDFITTAFRIALGMGLHRHLPKAGFSTAELETRRRLWWYILHLDVMSSASSGLSPLFINDKMSNTDKISQYDQKESDQGKGLHEIDLRYLVASNRYEITKKMRVVLRLHFEDALQSTEQVHDIAKQLKAVADQVSATTEVLLGQISPPPTGDRSAIPSIAAHTKRANTAPTSFDRIWRLEPDGSDTDVLSFRSWSAILLHLMVHKAFCVLYHAIFRDPATASNVSVRTGAVQHAQAFLQLFIRVCDDPISEPFHWMYPGTYQPLQAISLLLADLLQHPHSNEASLSRGLVDAIFDLYQVDEGIVSQNEPPRRRLSPSGRDAWSMLVRSRKNALEQMGEDHHVLLPSRMAYSDV